MHLEHRGLSLIAGNGSGFLQLHLKVGEELIVREVDPHFNLSVDSLGAKENLFPNPVLSLCHG